MNGAELVFGILLMVTGVGLVIAAIFRTARRGGHAGAYEVLALPVAGAALILLGRWILQ